MQGVGHRRRSPRFGNASRSGGPANVWFRGTLHPCPLQRRENVSSVRTIQSVLPDVLGNGLRYETADVFAT